jgi:hypothetical protein
MIPSDRIGVPRAVLVRVLSALVWLAPAAPSAAQGYGLRDQVLALGPAAFHPTQSAVSFDTGFTDGYLYGLTDYDAPVPLPDGAEIFQVCLYAYVDDPAFPTNAVIRATKQVPGGQTPHIRIVADSFVEDDIPIGYGTVCTAPFSYVVHDFEDIDADGTPDPIAHSVRAYVANGFGGVRIFWRRQVSAPPDTPTFDDVPANDPYYQYIEALVASGITSGCGTNPPRYCPEVPLTRRQMAVFLAKALGLHWPN